MHRTRVSESQGPVLSFLEHSHPPPTCSPRLAGWGWGGALALAPVRPGWTGLWLIPCHQHSPLPAASGARGSGQSVCVCAGQSEAGCPPPRPPTDRPQPERSHTRPLTPPQRRRRRAVPARGSLSAISMAKAALRISPHSVVGPYSMDPAWRRQGQGASW